MVVGSLVREDCSVPSKARHGVITKVTKIPLSKNSQWEQELRRWEQYQDKKQSAHGFRSCNSECFVIRPGYVASVRWQNNPQDLSVHVFYQENKTSTYNHGSNGIEIVG
jgi:hypothetical protein